MLALHAVGDWSTAGTTRSSIRRAANTVLSLLIYVLRGPTAHRQSSRACILI